MSAPLFTRCPKCSTIFRVTAEHLTQREGRVRCGQCQTVFDGRKQLVEPKRSALARPEYELEEGYDPSKGPNTMTLRRAVSEGENEGGAEARAENAPMEIPVRMSSALSEKTGHRRALYHWGLGALSFLLFLVLFAQAAFFYRDRLAAEYAFLGPALKRACQFAHCAIGPPREMGRVTIEASDLQSDPARKGLLVLSATLRNRAGYVVAYPDLELSLTDMQGQVAARRIFSPDEYLAGKSPAAAGLPAGEERYVALRIDAGGLSADGYKLESFYR